MDDIKKEISLPTFQQHAKTLGVEFVDGTVKVPLNMDKDLFLLLTLYYIERDNISKNSKWMSRSILETMGKCENMEEVKGAIKSFSEMMDHIY